MVLRKQEWRKTPPLVRKLVLRPQRNNCRDCRPAMRKSQASAVEISAFEKKKGSGEPLPFSMPIRL
jgi:hypothetical protein